MFEKLSESSGNIIGVKLAGMLTDEDYKYFVPELEKIRSAHSKIRLLLLTAYPQKFKPKATWDDLVFWIKHIKNIERLCGLSRTITKRSKDWLWWAIVVFSRKCPKSPPLLCMRRSNTSRNPRTKTRCDGLGVTLNECAKTDRDRTNSDMEG